MNWLSIIFSIGQDQVAVEVFVLVGLVCGLGTFLWPLCRVTATVLFDIGYKMAMVSSTSSSALFDVSSCPFSHESLSHGYGGHSGFMAIVQWLCLLVLRFFGK